MLFTKPEEQRSPRRSRAACRRLREELAFWERATAGGYLAGPVSAADYTLYPELALVQRMASRNPGVIPADLCRPERRRLDAAHGDAADRAKDLAAPLAVSSRRVLKAATPTLLILRCSRGARASKDAHCQGNAPNRRCVLRGSASASHLSMRRVVAILTRSPYLHRAAPPL